MRPVRRQLRQRISASSRRCSEWRHTAHKQLTEVRITYRFHPRFGETVLIKRCLERGGIKYFVVHQPDGTFACLPAWMMQPSATWFEICDKPNFSLDILRSLRTQVDDLLGFLPSESRRETANNDAAIQRSPAKPVRRTAQRAAAGPAGPARSCRRSSAPRDLSSTRRGKAQGE